MHRHLYNIFADAWLKDCDSIYVYSDPHFGDLDSYKLRFPNAFPIPENMNEEECKQNHEFRVKMFDNEQIKNINSFAGKTACLIILGDVGNIECVKKLKAKYKVLIMGNHDKGASNYKRVIKPSEKKIDEIIDSREVTSQERDFIRAYVTGGMLMGIHSYMDDNHLFDEVYEGPLMINDRVILSHEPIDVPDYMFNIHGHVHNFKNYNNDKNHLNCCAESIKYKPINLLTLIDQGLLSGVDSIHRETIDKAIARKIV